MRKLKTRKGENLVVFILLALCMSVVFMMGFVQYQNGKTVDLADIACVQKGFLRSALDRNDVGYFAQPTIYKCVGLEWQKNPERFILGEE